MRNTSTNKEKIIVRTYKKKKILEAYKHCGGEIEDYKLLGDVLKDYFRIKNKERKEKCTISYRI